VSENALTERDIRRHIGQFAIAGFDGQTVPTDLRALVRAFDLAGVVLFARNVASPEQVAELAAEVSSLGRDLPLWVGVDQEGGRVARFRRPFTEWPPMATLGRSGDEDLTERFARALAAELRAVGATLDFAPVIDVLTNPANQAIGDRALGDRPDVVARLGRIVIRGLQAGGVAACAKHFPGHGDTTADSHEALPLVEHSPDRLRAVELEPFRAAADEGVAGIMTAHLLVPAIDGERPATLSPLVIGSWLRGELGYDGLVVSDDLGMRAISERHSLADATVGAVSAGCDLVLLCNSTADEQACALEALIHAVEDGTIRPREIEASFGRQRAAKARFLAPAMSRASAPDAAVIGCDRHQAIAREMKEFL
jgi:beta-N-acetylhexosaminidase